jgi:hypothetical protein
MCLYVELPIFTEVHVFHDMFKHDLGMIVQSEGKRNACRIRRGNPRRKMVPRIAGF